MTPDDDTQVGKPLVSLLLVAPAQTNGTAVCACGASGGSVIGYSITTCCGFHALCRLEHTTVTL